MMDYGKSGNAKPDKNIPKHKVGRGLGAEKSPTGGKASKDELVARLKAAAEKNKANNAG